MRALSPLPPGGRRPRSGTVLAPVAAALLLLGTAAPASAAPAAPAAPAAAPAPDDFYVPPSPLPAGAPGDVIRARRSDAGTPTATRLADAWQVMYLSTNATGQRMATTGTVLVPKGVDRTKAPIIGFGPGTQGPAFRCAPSKMIESSAFYDQSALNDLLTKGYAVTVPDYEGYRQQPKSTYVVGRSMGPAMLDLVRAAQRMPDTSLAPGAKVVFRGYSQGGGAALWAGELQPAYAPELNLVGVSAGGVPADLVQVSLPLEGKAGFGVLAYALKGLDNAYPELKLDTFLNDAGRAMYSRMESGECLLELLLGYQGKRIQDYMTRSPVLDPPWLARIAENKLGATPPKVPVFQYHADQDELVAFPQAQALRTTYCAAGVQLTWKAYNSGHISLVYHGNADSLAFIADRLAGTPATTNC
ncbi:lipase [Actinomadura craniellae]|uniref:Lipase n=1 Tax=Actinomadura craniellae TaxID=2231787 RepID=A0A365GW48_9ACTN|nr:lipase family protein [Actinomadura craniellae]RAY11035.1 lipase [Actinomadura craniellae]